MGTPLVEPGDGDLIAKRGSNLRRCCHCRWLRGRMLRLPKPLRLRSGRLWRVRFPRLTVALARMPSGRRRPSRRSRRISRFQRLLLRRSCCRGGSGDRGRASVGGCPAARSARGFGSEARASRRAAHVRESCGLGCSWQAVTEMRVLAARAAGAAAVGARVVPGGLAAEGPNSARVCRARPGVVVPLSIGVCTRWCEKKATRSRRLIRAT